MVLVDFQGFHVFFQGNKNQRSLNTKTPILWWKTLGISRRPPWGVSGEASASSEEARIGASAVVMGVVDRNLVFRAIGSVNDHDGY